MKTWQLQKAKARLSEVIRQAQTAPQAVTVRGKKRAIILSPEEYARLTGNKPKKPNFVEFMRQSPLYGLDIEFERDKSLPRDVEF